MATEAEVRQQISQTRQQIAEQQARFEAQREAIAATPTAVELTKQQLLRVTPGERQQIRALEQKRQEQKMAALATVGTAEAQFMETISPTLESIQQAEQAMASRAREAQEWEVAQRVAFKDIPLAGLPPSMRAKVEQIRAGQPQPLTVSEISAIQEWSMEHQQTPTPETIKEIIGRSVPGLTFEYGQAPALTELRGAERFYAELEAKGLIKTYPGAEKLQEALS